MDSQSFLAQAVDLELEAETVYGRLVELTADQPDASQFFQLMAEYCRQHRESIMRQTGMREVPPHAAPTDALPRGDVPRASAATAAADLTDAMAVALAAERRAVDYYANVAAATGDAEIRRQAEEFAAEERRHVLALERYMGLKPY